MFPRPPSPLPSGETVTNRPTTPDLSGVRHHQVDALGTRIHVAEAGDGPLVLFVHGFPESWYSWRFQLPAVAAAGYRAAAIDVRGYGRSAAPAAIEEYAMVRHVGDNVGVVRALDCDTAAIVGHDWGSPIAWSSALLRPDVFTSVALLSVPYNARSDFRPSAAFRLMGGDEEFYIEYFQEPGRAEAEIEADLAKWLAGMYFSASGDGVRARIASGDGSGGRFTVPAGGKLSDRFVWPEPGHPPAWMSEDDFGVYLAEFQRTGLSGGLNRYRNVDRDWADMAAWDGAPIVQPSLFVGGEVDGPTVWGAGSIAQFPTTMPNLHKSVIVEGSGHWVQQEAAEQVNAELLEFLAAL
ncbi:MAG TPA: epoxide hydrolase [Acidimicrobiaceae bacterium]|nr:epoxide hydrolase [Acidimicrobiaceae bacterium]HCB37455.1 epoxide hydrolase [Acidimicrobiaceae bacterium]